jgi:hypothetical protein
MEWSYPMPAEEIALQGVIKAGNLREPNKNGNYTIGIRLFNRYKDVLRHNQIHFFEKEGLHWITKPAALGKVKVLKREGIKASKLRRDSTVTVVIKRHSYGDNGWNYVPIRLIIEKPALGHLDPMNVPLIDDIAD